MSQAIRQEEVPPGESEQDYSGCHEKGSAVTDACQQSADGWADHKTHARRATSHTEVFAALLRLGNVSDVAKEDAEIAARQSINNTSQEEDRKRTAQAKEQVANR